MIPLNFLPPPCPSSPRTHILKLQATRTRMKLLLPLSHSHLLSPPHNTLSVTASLHPPPQSVMVRHSDSTQLSSTPLSVIQPCVCACATRSRPILYWVRGVYRRCWGTALQQACFCLTSAPPSRPPFPLPHCWSANRPPFSDLVCRCIRHAMQAPFLLKATPPPDRTRRLARFSHPVAKREDTYRDHLSPYPCLHLLPWKPFLFPSLPHSVHLREPDPGQNTLCFTGSHHPRS